MTPQGTRFDQQASDFDQRAGVGPAASAIARGIVDLTGAGVVLEIGPGTGEIGAHLAAAASRYVGVDASSAMLQVFAGRTPARALLLLADAARAWPVRDGAVDLVFSSRAVHLLDIDHVAVEVARVCRPRGHVLLGRVQRQPDGLRSRLRERRRALLAERGFEAAEGRDRSRRLLHALAAGGAAPIEQRTLARWTVTTSATRLFDQWDTAATVGGRPIPPEVNADVMGRLRAEAPTESFEEAETYTVEGVRLPLPTETT